MKKLLQISVLVLLTGISIARADEKDKTKGDEKHVPSTSLQNNDSHSTLMMKISEDENGDEVRRKALKDELRKLYKANFL